MRAIAITCALLAAVASPVRCQPPQAMCANYLPQLIEYAPQAGWDATRMAQIMWRESRCDPTAYNARGRAAGLLQITPIGYPYLRGELGQWVDRWTLMDPVQNIRAAAALFDYWARLGRDGYRPWAL